MSYANPEQPKVYFEGIVTGYFKDKHLDWPDNDVAFAASILNEEVGKLTHIANDVRAGGLSLDDARPHRMRYAGYGGAMGLRAGLRIWR